MTYGCIRLEYDEGVARLTLARPDALNAINRQMLGELIDAFDNLAKNDTVRAVLIMGAGTGFSSGADLSSGGSPGGKAGFDCGAVLEEYYNPLIMQMFDFPKPIVAAVHGGVVGAGCMLALAADIVVSAQSAFFLLAFVKAGLVPDAGSTWLIPRLIGPARARAAMMLAERIAASTAKEWGMIYDVVADNHLDRRATEIAKKLARGPTRAYSLIRRGVKNSLASSLDDTLLMERSAQRDAGETADFLEGIAAFRERRAPIFAGK